jgi:hypothetical protein
LLTKLNLFWSKLFFKWYFLNCFPYPFQTQYWICFLVDLGEFFYCFIIHMCIQGLDHFSRTVFTRMSFSFPNCITIHFSYLLAWLFSSAKLTSKGEMIPLSCSWPEGVSFHSFYIKHQVGCVSMVNIPYCIVEIYSYSQCSEEFYNRRYIFY